MDGDVGAAVEALFARLSEILCRGVHLDLEHVLTFLGILLDDHGVNGLDELRGVRHDDVLRNLRLHGEGEALLRVAALLLNLEGLDHRTGHATFADGFDKDDVAVVGHGCPFVLGDRVAEALAALRGIARDLRTALDEGDPLATPTGTFFAFGLAGSLFGRAHTLGGDLVDGLFRLREFVAFAEKLGSGLLQGEARTDVVRRSTEEGRERDDLDHLALLAALAESDDVGFPDFRQETHDLIALLVTPERPQFFVAIIGNFRNDERHEVGEFATAHHLHDERPAVLDEFAGLDVVGRGVAEGDDAVARKLKASRHCGPPQRLGGRNGQPQG